MTVSYFDTVAAVQEAEGLAWADMTRAMRVHVRSLQAEGLVASFAGEDVTTINDPEGVVWFTEQGAAYVDMLTEAGLIAAPEGAESAAEAAEQEAEQEAAQVPTEKPRKRTKKSRKRGGKVTTRKGTVPSPEESLVESPVLPEGQKARRVPGNQHGDQLIPVDTEQDRVAALERKVSALMAALAS